MRVVCPHCGAAQDVDHAAPGAELRCPQCRAVFPTPPASPADAGGLGVVEPSLASHWAGTWAGAGAVLLLLTYLWPYVVREGEDNRGGQRTLWFWEGFRDGAPWNLPWKEFVGGYLAPALGVATLLILAATRGRLRAILLVALPAIAIAVAYSLGENYHSEMQFYSAGNALYALGVVALLAGNRVRRSHPRSRIAMVLAGVGALSALVPSVVPVGLAEKSNIGWLLDPGTWSHEWSSAPLAVTVLLELAIAVVGLLSFLPGDRPSVRRAVTMLGWAVVLLGPVAMVTRAAIDDLARVPETASVVMKFGMGRMLGALTVFGVGLAALVEGFVRSHPSRAGNRDERSATMRPWGPATPPDSPSFSSS